MCGTTLWEDNNIESYILFLLAVLNFQNHEGFVAVLWSGLGLYSQDDDLYWSIFEQVSELASRALNAKLFECCWYYIKQMLQLQVEIFQPIFPTCPC